ncbi:MAG: hypothetical protein KIT31_01075 [Deltaproteobacteria bacterium]|nr:hypothetical protein [Deltaproteobacteria bacterium]
MFGYELLRRRGFSLSRYAAGLLFVIVTILSPRAEAQLAPMGGHYAARPTDTGHAVTPNGGYSTSVPLELGEARAGLPIPLQVVYGGRGFGAAGVGWDVPLSYVHVDSTYARRRPKEAAGALLHPRERVVVSLLGQQLDMIRVGNTDRWLSRRDAATFELQRGEVVAYGPSVWKLYDGEGRTFEFYQDSRIRTADLWLLRSIKHLNNSVEVKYDISEPRLPGSGDTALAIDIASIDYNLHPDGTCHKDHIALAYDVPQVTSPQSAPLALSIVGGRTITRSRRLTRIGVGSRPNCGSTNTTEIRSYVFNYAVDPDTRQDRLASVHVTGRAGTTEESTPVLVASYTYGTASSNNALRYRSTQSIPMPGGIWDQNVVSVTARNTSVSTPYSDASFVYATSQSLTDITGDGRPDLIYSKGNQLWVVRNLPGVSGNTTLGLINTKLTDSTLPDGPLEVRSTKTPRFSAPSNASYTWRQAIDVNGDGRIDIIDASEEPDHWAIYLNKPSTSLSGVTWVRYSYDITALYRLFAQRGHAVEGGYLPLSRRTTGRDSNSKVCWSYNSGHWWPRPLTECGAQQVHGFGPEKTFVEWEVRDLNGDGYPDVIFNSSPVDEVVDRAAGSHPEDLYPEGSEHQPHENEKFLGTSQLTLRPSDPDNEIQAVLNVTGVRMHNNHGGPDEKPFSHFIRIAGDSKLCGVAQWVSGAFWTTDPSPGDSQLQRSVCGLADVNGDGLLDRIEESVVLLGTGVGFSDESIITLPGKLADHRTTHDVNCGLGEPLSHDEQVAGLRDLTGDGVPDFIEWIDGGWHVHIGTGAGFADPIPIDGTFTLSQQVEACDGSTSKSVTGLYDIDGDGKPETVRVNHGILEVFQLLGGSTVRTPEAGRLITINNGHGAVTSVTYRSAKEDGQTLHRVPFPEIVVASVETTGTKGLGGSRTITQYAYGGAEMFFDPVLDRFHMAGYRRTVELVREPRDGSGHGKLIDTYPLEDFDLTMSESERFGRYLRVGRVRDTTVLAGNLGTDPWNLLSVDITSDPRRIAGTHNTFAARAVTSVSGTDWCWDIMDPYNIDVSLSYNISGNWFGFCNARGFLYSQEMTSWRGSMGPPSDANVKTSTFVRAVDSYGRPTSIIYLNDVWNDDDDYCVDVEFAAPIGTQERVLSAPARTTVSDCGRTGGTFLVRSFLYDHLPAGSVWRGLVTRRNTDNYNTATGQYIGSSRDFDAFYDGSGNPISVVRARGTDTHVTYVTYDPFGIAAVRVSSQATGTPPLESSVVLDPITLAVATSVDPNGSEQSNVVDGFGRPVLAKFRAPGGTEGVVAQLSYQGFTGGDALGRRVVTKVFSNPVDPAGVMTAAGRTHTDYFDELGRPRYTRVELGADYGSETLISGARTYDGLGRVVFQSDPYPASESAATAYGTTQYFSADGTPSCVIRGRGPQDFTTVTDEANERYPTCYSHTFSGHQESLAVQTADSLLASSAQAGVIKQEVATAIGRPVSRTTWRNGARLEHAAFTHDRLGNRTSFTRYQNPASATNPVTWTWTYDSLGQVLSLGEPDTALQERSYSNWGEIVEMRWTPQHPEPTHSVIYRYDARSRLTHREEQNGGILDLESVADYEYDIGVAPTSLVSPTFVLGRLARATAPTGDISFSYDASGHVNARSFTSAEGPVVEKHAFNGDGSRAAIELYLPDTGWKAERVDYEYDSAGRAKQMNYSASSGNQLLYKASTTDALGRLRKAQFGNSATYTASYADTGRRLLENVEVISALGFRRLTPSSYDPIGRERARSEKGFGRNVDITPVYDPLGRVIASLKVDGAETIDKWSFNYDALGNILFLDDKVGTRDAALSYLTTDRDRLCRIDYVSSGNATCNVRHDSFGNIAEQPTRTGVNQLLYFNSGAIRTIRSSSGASADFRYNAFGGVQELNIVGGVPGTEVRLDRRYGEHVVSRSQINDGKWASYTARSFPGPGVRISRRGAKGPWNFAFDESRGARFSVDEKGAFVQSLDYQPYGETTSTGAQPGTVQFSTEQWNEGDALAPFGLVQLGARIYDPVIGRFLSRDPLILPRTAATSNPYAFAMNDPQNLSDPSGLDPCGGSGLCIWSSTEPSSGDIAFGATLAAIIGLVLGTDQSVPVTDATSLAFNVTYQSQLIFLATAPPTSSPFSLLKGSVTSAFFAMSPMLNPGEFAFDVGEDIHRGDYLKASIKIGLTAAAAVVPALAELRAAKSVVAAGSEAAAAVDNAVLVAPRVIPAARTLQTNFTVSNRLVGAGGEEVAVNWLARRGYTNIRSIQNASGHGIDIIAEHGGQTYYFEVKASQNAVAGALSARQSQPISFISDILRKAAARGPYWGKIPASVSADARALQQGVVSGGAVIEVTNVGSSAVQVTGRSWGPLPMAP